MQSNPYFSNQSIARAKNFLIATLICVLPITASADENCNNDFPTTAIADYVLGCMAANGNKFESLHQCSCSIDFIKERMVYDEYERAQTIMRAQLDQGQRGIFYRESKWGKKYTEKLERLQAESTLRCF